MPKTLDNPKPQSTATETPPHKKVDRVAEDAAKKATVTEQKYDDRQKIFSK